MNIKAVDLNTIKDNPEAPVCNTSDNRYFADIIQARYSRRTLLKGSLGVAAVSFLGAGLAACGGSSSSSGSGNGPLPAPRLGFESVPITRADTITVPAGYTAKAFVPWGTPITGAMPAFMTDGSNTGIDQLQQVGSHHDGMHYFPIDGSSDHGLLVINHEYVDKAVVHANGASSLPRPIDEVRKEMAAHGVSVIEIQKNASGDWEVVTSMLNRRITAFTEMELKGPVRGDDRVKTAYSPEGTHTRGTLNNCAHGYTPWGTYLTCEENWPGYFHVDIDPLPREFERFGISGWQQNHWHQAEEANGELTTDTAFTRFGVVESGADATEDFRNEPNNFGWIVEIDPFDPDSTPVKRTALGRFSHEGIVFAEPKVGEPMVFYSGDDARFEYIYKFVSKNNYQEGLRGDDLLDEGTLYVARFNDDGTGEWLALDIDDVDFMAAVAESEYHYTTQAEVLLNTRRAADIAGATRMDRPEWGAICPRTGMVYFTLTNNTARSADDTNPANPRANSQVGHIIRWQEDGNAAATTFAWDIFALAGNTLEHGFQTGYSYPAGKNLDDSNIFAAPDGLWFDDNGVLWIQTDTSGALMGGTGPAGDFGNNAMLAAEPDTGVIKRFLVGPVDCEVTGVVMTPDKKTMFVNIQHPGDSSSPNNFSSHWPAEVAGARPRSATVVITRDDGGEIGIA
ncbi:PhoX family protein [Isoalcanivorax indicus]|uniref:PhoX family protein n=1 Tax=Isoalcanivorax indicus TaxID=2202653 RepID=UPI001FE69F9E|nr:PhoX family phosphatase [Isoalcanivorax indicus]